MHPLGVPVLTNRLLPVVSGAQSLPIQLLLMPVDGAHLPEPTPEVGGLLLNPRSRLQ